MKKTKNINAKIARYMFRLRKRKLFTRDKVVEITGLSLSTIKNVENKKHDGGMQVKTLKLLCSCYGTTLSKIFRKLKM